MKDLLTERARNSRQSKIREVTRMVERAGGVNLGQGTCALPPDERVIVAAKEALEAGHNSYSFYDGVTELKQALVDHYGTRRNLSIKPENVLVTCGATGAYECICKAFLDPGDEVILLEPIYQYHEKLALERGAVLRYVPLDECGWTLVPERLEASMTSKTKLLVFSNPSNPCGKVFSKSELETIAAICQRAGVVIVCDEVYEHILSPPEEHLSIASLPGCFEQTLTISSASKTFFVTGWRVGWLIGPEEVMGALGVKSDETYVCAPTPLQHAVARCLRFESGFFEDIGRKFAARKERLCRALRRAGLTLQAPAGAYYILADYRSLGFSNDMEATNRFIQDFNVGAVPGSAFFPSRADTGLLRFCFAVTDRELDRACEFLERSPSQPLRTKGA
jgi:aminotransferase